LRQSIPNFQCWRLNVIARALSSLETPIFLLQNLSAILRCIRKLAGLANRVARRIAAGVL
jgi:hypothetical protein